MKNYFKLMALIMIALCGLTTSCDNEDEQPLPYILSDNEYERVEAYLKLSTKIRPIVKIAPFVKIFRGC
jgi:hypothetical protein